MIAKIHAENPADPAACTCGYRYPEYCRGRMPIILATDREKIIRPRSRPGWLSRSRPGPASRCKPCAASSRLNSGVPA